MKRGSRVINREDFTPLYAQVYEELKKDLVQYPTGSNLPPERILCKQYSVDRVTVRKALSMLAEEGYIERRQGRGTKVVCHEAKSVGTVVFFLSQGKNRTDRIGEPFYARSYDALEEQLQVIGKRLIYSKLLPDDDIAELCRNLEAQAVILSCTPDDPVLEECKKVGLPIVCYNTCIDGLPSVTVDNDSAAAVSARYLLGHGHRSIGFIHVPGYVNSELRLNRYKIEIENSGVPGARLQIAEGDWTEEGGYRAAKELLSAGGSEITAVFGGNDSMAIGAMRAARDQGLRVPEDISIVGFDGISQSAITSPPLTTLKVDLDSMAESTCMIIEHIQTRRSAMDINVLVSAGLIVRGSVAEANDNNIE